MKTMHNHRTVYISKDPVYIVYRNLKLVTQLDFRHNILHVHIIV